jgi:hypothetical protein
VASSTADASVLRVEREDGELLVLDGLGLAHAFFTDEAPTDADGSQALGDPLRIELEDIVTMNRTMRSRSSHRLWEPVLSSDQGWLRAIPVELDLLATDDEQWAAIDGDRLLSDAVRGCIGPGIALAGATKLLHLKRPRLTPILDSLVAQLLGLTLSPRSAPQDRVRDAERLCAVIRREGRRNLPALRLIQESLDGNRSLIRIFDAVLWSAHPAASLSGARRTITVNLR